MGLFLIILQVLGALPALITSAEGIFGRGNGAQKKQHVLEFVDTAARVAATAGAKELEAPGARDALAAAAGALTDAIVAGFNAAKVFQHDEQQSS